MEVLFMKNFKVYYEFPPSWNLGVGSKEWGVGSTEKGKAFVSKN
jgi:hypothetical protein